MNNTICVNVKTVLQEPNVEPNSEAYFEHSVANVVPNFHPTPRYSVTSMNRLYVFSEKLHELNSIDQ